ncbi:GNAT family N-acetyltransferase [Paraclostridium sordellii]|uniref:GNAT family N-acetyltransferase n=1 Tax=Paraclostridium sordellii TaxID=1505 RepID=UPI001A9B0C92|nr:GNAT family N-acetyltransferase [Paeniclostridium sordellii]MCR1850732.1 GNAT family N-acetyltransferase [Paeniclostridium sordellii]
MKGSFSIKRVIYRNILDSDYEIIKQLIGDAFSFAEFIKDKELLDIVLSGYLQDCILDSSFSKVAQIDNKIIGFILGNAKKDKNRISNCVNPLNFNNNEIDLIISNKENKNLLKEFSKITDAYKELINKKENTFQGCIQLFVVSGESRGLGVGKNLIKYLFDYMKSIDVKSLYLFTDTRCNYGFYDSQNFNKIDEKEIYFDSIGSSLNIFLYSYNF